MRATTLSLLMMLGGMSMMVPIAAASTDTGSLDELLKVQDLGPEDLQANRDGRISKHQLDIIASHRNQWTTVLFASIGAMVLTAGLLAFINYQKNKKPMVFTVPAIMVAFGLVLYLIYVVFLRLPSGIADRKVTLMEAPIEKLLVAPTRGEFIATIGGVNYTGFTGTLPHELEGHTVKAYVVAEDKLVVAIEPAK